MQIEADRIYPLDKIVDMHAGLKETGEESW